MYIPKSNLGHENFKSAFGEFKNIWNEVMTAECHQHEIWQGDFCETLNNPDESTELKFRLASVWGANMVMGSFCFPKYVAVLASRTESDYIRHGLLENAWDESGGQHHTSRSHYWLAVKLMKALGITEPEVEQITPIPEALNYAKLHYEACRDEDLAIGLGMISLIEEFTTPEFTMIFNALLQSCSRNLDVTQNEFILNGGGEYFTANIADDERHREEMPRLVFNYLVNEGHQLRDITEFRQSLEQIRLGIRLSIKLRREFFNGISNFVSKGGDIRAMIRT